MHIVCRFICAAAAAVLSGALGSGVMVAPAAAQPAPAGDAFYTPPSPLPPGLAGGVIWSRALDGTMALPGAAKNLLVLYRSVDPAGAPVAVSGTISLPAGEPPAGGWPVISWTHGTTGLAAICGPSRDGANGPEHNYIEVIRTLLDAFVRKGYAVVASDYQGLGTNGFHPFLQGVPNARNALDIIRAARQIEPRLGVRYGVMGHSQGGHADLFTAAQGPLYAPELTLVANVAMAPGSQIMDRLAAVMASNKFELGLPYTVYVLNSYSTTFPEIDIKKILTAQAIAHIPDLFDGCMTKSLTVGYWSKAIARDQFVANPDLTALGGVAAKNEPGSLKITVPTLIMQGMKDVTVRPIDTDALARQLCAGGNSVEYVPLPDADHDGSMSRGGGRALAWMDARFAQTPAASNCTALPAAGRG